MTIRKMLRNMCCAALAIFQLAACTTSSDQIPAGIDSGPVSAVRIPDYVIQPGDELDIRFFSTPELNEVVTVRPDGRISLPLVDAGRVTGITPEELDARLTQQYSEQLIDPDIIVMVKFFAGQKVYVGGEVKKPGVIEFTSPITVIEAAIMAGGFTKDSRLDEILVIRKDADNRPHALRINAGDSLAGTALLSEPLRATDVVYVPRSGIANANLFIDQYIRGLLMFGGFRMSFGYDLDDPNTGVP